MIKHPDWPMIVPTMALVVFFLLLGGCGTDPATRIETKDVLIPVAVKRDAPEALTADPEFDLPVFVDPSHPEAAVALTDKGARALKDLLLVLTGRLKAWEAWAEAE